ncbi:MAG: hypothetical protein ACRC92_16125 [Peptostreptococcaceae bacterium]
MKRIIDYNHRNQIVNIILEEVSLKAYAIYIFGSSLEVREDIENHINIVVITECKISIKDKYSLQQRLSDYLRLSINLVILWENNVNLMLKILHGGYLLYERQDYNDVFENVYDELEFDFYFMEKYMEEYDKFL